MTARSPRSGSFGRAQPTRGVDRGPREHERRSKQNYVRPNQSSTGRRRHPPRETQGRDRREGDQKRRKLAIRHEHRERKRPQEIPRPREAQYHEQRRRHDSQREHREVLVGSVAEEGAQRGDERQQDHGGHGCVHPPERRRDPCPAQPIGQGAISGPGPPGARRTPACNCCCGVVAAPGFPGARAPGEPGPEELPLASHQSFCTNKLEPQGKA